MAISTLLGYTNIVLTLSSMGTGLKKFAAYDGTTEVLTGLEVVKCNADISAKLFEHPLENGAVISDHRILNPKRASIQAYIAIDDAETLKELSYYYTSSTPLKIRVENTVIDNTYIENQPFEVSPGCLDKTLYSITFKEAEEITPVYVELSNASNPANTSIVNSGQKQGTSVNRSWAFSLLNGGRTS